jgi:hypothetical protein
VPVPEPRRTAPAAPRAEAPVVDVPIFEDNSPPFSTSRADPTQPTALRPVSGEIRPAPRSADRPPEIQHEAAPKRVDDTALSAAIDRALDETDRSAPK